MFPGRLPEPFRGAIVFKEQPVAKRSSRERIMRRNRDLGPEYSAEFPSLLGAHHHLLVECGPDSQPVDGQQRQVQTRPATGHLIQLRDAQRITAGRNGARLAALLAKPRGDRQGWQSAYRRLMHREGTDSVSVTLINIFEIPAGDEDAFIAAWEKSRDYLMKLPAHIETALHQSLHDARFRFVNIAHWNSEEEFNDAVRSQGFREASADLRWPMSPALYRVVRTG